MAPRLAAFLLGLSLASAGCERPAWPGEPGDTQAPSARSTLRVTLANGSGQPLAGAWVVLAPLGRDQQTDEAGVASFYALDPGSYTVEGAAYGYELGRQDVAVDGEEHGLTLTLEARAASHAAARRDR